MRMLKENDFGGTLLSYSKILMHIWNNLGMWIYFFSTVNFVKSKYRSSTSDEHLASKLRYVVKHTVDFEDKMNTSH